MHVPGCREDPAAPQRLAAVVQAAPAPVMRRDEIELTPPIDTDSHQSSSITWRKSRCRNHAPSMPGTSIGVSLRDRPDRRRVQVVVVVVGDHHGIDPADRLQRDRRAAPTVAVRPESRVDHTGSVRIVRPPICTTYVAWPTHVTALCPGAIAGSDDAGACGIDRRCRDCLGTVQHLHHVRRHPAAARSAGPRTWPASRVRRTCGGPSPGPRAPSLDGTWPPRGRDASSRTRRAARSSSPGSACPA